MEKGGKIKDGYIVFGVINRSLWMRPALHIETIALFVFGAGMWMRNLVTVQKRATAPWSL
jgi:hypothetical protein